MIIPDVNLLVYAHDEAAPAHDAARSWWEDLLNGDGEVGLPWAVILGFVRVTTHPSILRSPLTVEEATTRVSGWLRRDNVLPLNPAHDHWQRLRTFLGNLGSAGNLTTDAHIAALALEYRAEVQSNDSDFSRFPGLRWKNPLSD